MMKLPKACRRENNKILCDIDGKSVEMKECMFYLGRSSACIDKENKNHYMRDKILKVDMHPENQVDQKSYAFFNVGNKEMHAYEKPLYHAGFLSDLGNDGDKVELVNPHRNLVFLKLNFTKDKVIGIDPQGTIRPLTFDKNTEIFYEPWMMDVGSFLFINPPETEIAGDMLKLATEGDIMREWKD